MLNNATAIEAYALEENKVLAEYAEIVQSDGLSSERWNKLRPVLIAGSKNVLQVLEYCTSREDYSDLRMASQLDSKLEDIFRILYDSHREDSEMFEAVSGLFTVVSSDASRAFLAELERQNEDFSHERFAETAAMVAMIKNARLGL